MATLAEYIDATRPKPDDFDNPADYQTALNAWTADLNGGSMFQPPGEDPNNPGMFYAGSTNQATEGEYQANYLNNRYAQAEVQRKLGNADHPNNKMLGLAMRSRASIRPEETQAAYQAVRPDGTPMLLPYVASLLESLGYGMDMPGSGGAGGGIPATGGDDGGFGPDTGTVTPGATPGTPTLDPSRGDYCPPGSTNIDGVCIPTPDAIISQSPYPDANLTGETGSGEWRDSTAPPPYDAYPVSAPLGAESQAQAQVLDPALYPPMIRDWFLKKKFGNRTLPIAPHLGGIGYQNG